MKLWICCAVIVVVVLAAAGIIAVAHYCYLASCGQDTGNQAKPFQAMLPAQSDPDKMQDELRKTQAALQKAQDELAEVKSQRDALSDRLEKAQPDLTSASRTRDQLRKKISSLEAELDKTKSLLADSSRSSQQLHKQIDVLTKERDDAVAKARINYQTAVEKKLKSPEPGQTVPPPGAPPLQDDILARKMQDAQSYVQSGNWQAAERVMNEVRAANPNYPGLDSLNSQITTMKNAPPSK